MARQVVALFKLRIGVTMVLTALVGMAVAIGELPHNGWPNGWQIAVLAGAVLLSSGSAGAFNHYYDHDIDAHMTRTCGRPFVTGVLHRTSKRWLWMMGLLLVVSIVAALLFTNIVSALFVFLGAFFYGVVYTVWLKRRTWLNIIIGGLAGSFAMLAGAAVVNPNLGFLPILLAFIIFLWTPPHFWSLAIVLHEEYAAAKIPMLPVVAGDTVAARAILVGVVLLVAASFAPVFFGMNWIYLVGIVTGGGYFLIRSFQLFKNPTPVRARASFRASLVQLMTFLGGALLDVWLLG